MPSIEWMDKYEKVKGKLECKTDLEAYFTEKTIGKMAVDTLDIGSLYFPTGEVFTCDPLMDLDEARPYIQKIPVGTYPVKICVVPSEDDGNRYACVKVSVSNEKPVRYELGMIGFENLDEEFDDGAFFGFGVDAGMGCIADIKTQEEFKTYWNKRIEEANDEFINFFDDLFARLLEKNSELNPKYQDDGCGNWLNWTVPGTDCNITIFSSGWGDGCYPTYFGYDAMGNVCGVYILFIDIENEF